MVRTAGKKKTAAERKKLRRQAELARKPGEHVLNTIEGAAKQVEIDSLMPGKSTTSGEDHLYRVVRTDEELDAVYGVVIERAPMPWWKWNNALRKGLVDGDALEEFVAGTGG